MPIETKRLLDGPRPASMSRMDSAARFGFRRSKPAGEQEQARVDWTLPSGWSELPPTRLRPGNFAVDGRPGLECYLTILPNGGTVVANVNRWRAQMGLDPISEADVEALSRRLILGAEGVFVDLEGTFGGMRGDQEKEDFRMIGVIAEVQGFSVFVKMIGPAAHVAAEGERFEELVRSLRPPERGSPSPGAFDPASLRWSAPANWVEGTARNMRVVTFTLESEPSAECYIAVLGSTGGGIAANVNRWRGQMGKGPLSDEEVARLPTAKVLGRDAVLVEVTGDFSGMTGGTTSSAAMLGAICSLDGVSLFVKMVGPEEAVLAERDRFRAFCESLRTP